MSKSSNLDQTVKRYLIDSIYSEGYEVDPQTTEEKIAFVEHEFHATHQWSIDRIGEQKALAEWLMGLPSIVNVEFTYYRIIALAKEWGSIPKDATVAEENKITENYWNFLAAKLCQLFHSYHIPKTED